jgi:anti-sigma regulatory factor (Ser/Thr protein kinase)
VGLARTSVRRLLARWGTGDGTADNAVLVTSELVTNAVKHTPSARIVCRVRVDGDRLHIEVEDESGGNTLPALRCPGPDDQGGRGLLLVGMVSSDWGVREAPHGSGRVVWAELAPEPGESVTTGPRPTPHSRPVPHPAEGSAPHGTTARL